MRDLHPFGMFGRDLGGFLDMGRFKGLGRGLGRLLLGLARGGGFIEEHKGYGKDDDPEETHVGADIHLADGQQGYQVAGENAADRQT